MAELVFVTFLPRPGAESRVLQILEGMVAATRQEPGNRLYDLYRSIGPEGRPRYHLLERYADEAAVRAHRETDHYRDYRAHIVPLLEAPIAVTLLEGLNVRGS